MPPSSVLENLQVLYFSSFWTSVSSNLLPINLLNCTMVDLILVILYRKKTVNIVNIANVKTPGRNFNILLIKRLVVSCMINNKQEIYWVSTDCIPNKVQTCGRCNFKSTERQSNLKITTFKIKNTFACLHLSLLIIRHCNAVI